MMKKHVLIILLYFTLVNFFVLGGSNDEMKFALYRSPNDTRNNSAVDIRKWYIGIGFGKTELEVDDDEGFFDIDDDDGFKFLGGYRLNQYIGIEIEYIDLGKHESNSVFFVAPFFVGTGTVSVETTGINFSLMGRLPLTNDISMFAKAGAFIWEQDSQLDLFGSQFRESEDNTDFSWGAGVNVKIVEYLSLRIEWQEFKFNEEFPFVDHEINMFSASLTYDF